VNLSDDKTLYGKSLGSNQAAFVMDFLYRMDLNGNKIIIGKSLVLNQAAFVADFSTIVSGV
jgi:hypothetical protein